MSTATKLEYLNDTKSLLKDSINSLGGEITSQTTFRNYVTELDSIYSKLPKVSGTGSVLSLSPTLKGRLGSTLKGNTLQNGTPTPSSPVPIKSVTGLQNITVCGKNLFDKNNIKIGYRFGSTGDYYANAGYNATNYYISVTPNTTYATSWTISQMECVCTYDSNKTFKRRIQSGTSFTTDSDEYFVRADVKDENLATAQIELGSTATTYEAYTGQIKELNLGKNLINSVGYNKGTNASGTITSNVNYLGINDYVKVEPNTTYAITFQDDVSGATLFLSSKDKNGDFIERVNLSNARTFTTGANTYYAFFYLYKNGTNFNTGGYVQLEKGSTPTSYSPYFTPIELNKINDYQDYITGTPDNWSIKRQIGSITLNGSETGWQYNNNFYYILISNIIYGNIQFSTGRTLCDDYTDYGITLWQDSSKTIPYGYLVNNGSIFIRNVDITSLENFKTYLSSHNIELVYQLETETTEPITNQEIINQLNEIYYLQSYNGTTNITITSEDLALIMNASALKGEA